MTDPTFDTLEALGTWAWSLSKEMADFISLGLFSEVDILAAQITRVRAAHSHLLKGPNDAPTP